MARIDGFSLMPNLELGPNSTFLTSLAFVHPGGAWASCGTGGAQFATNQQGAGLCRPPAATPGRSRLAKVPRSQVRLMDGDPGGDGNMVPDPPLWFAPSEIRRGCRAGPAFTWLFGGPTPNFSGAGASW